MMKLYTALVLALFAHNAAAVVGEPLGFSSLGAGGPLPLELGGMAAIAAVSLILGTQLIKRKK